MQNFISIPKPCHENWDAMTPQEQGRHCAKCNIVVQDFSVMSYEDIRYFFKQNPGRVCGRVNEKQLFTTPTLTNRLKHFLYALAIVFLPFIPTISFGQTKNTTQIENARNGGAIEGKISNINGEFIPFAAVSMYEGGILKGFAKSNMQGYYKIKPLAAGKYTLRITYVGYEAISIKDVTIHSGETFTLHPPPMKIKRTMLPRLTIEFKKEKKERTHYRENRHGGICVFHDEQDRSDKNKSGHIWIDLFNPNRQVISNE